MGYPMTWDRVVNRNHLMREFPKASMMDFPDRDKFNPDVDYEDLLKKHISELNQTLWNHYQWRSMLNSDLERLVADSTDEGSTCKYLAMRTGVDEDTVAAVLKEFFSW